MAKTKVKPQKVTGHKAICQAWVESERGWGQKDDGFSLHVDLKARDRYIKKENAGKKLPVPDVYVFASGGAYEVIVTTHLWKAMVKSKGSYRSFGNIPSPGAFVE